MKAEIALRTTQASRHKNTTKQGEILRGRYLYAVVRSGSAGEYGARGINGGLVYPLAHGPVAAVVSDVPYQKIRPERVNLAAHQEVLKRLMEVGALLPMSFGIIADGPKAIQKILARHQSPLVKQLNRVEGKVEMGLRVVWDVPNIFDYFVTTHPELRALRDEFFASHREPTQENKIEIGRMFERLLNEDREACAHQVEEALTPYCAEIKRSHGKHEREVMHLACLVGRDAASQAGFEGAVFQAASRFDRNFAFDYSGPWPPANFVDLNLKI
jgi:hypothetical protein